MMQDTTRQSDEMTISVSELVCVLLRSGKLVMAALAAGVVAGVVVSLLQSPAYLAQATFLPEKVSAASSISANVSERFSLWPMSSTSAGVFYSTILRSRAAAQMVSERLGCAEWLKGPMSGSDREQLAIDGLRESLRVTEEAVGRFSTGGGLITVSVEADDPVAAADIASTYALVLDEYLTENTVTSASRVRRFLEERLERTNQELELAQVELQQFQEKHGAINITAQASATIQLISELEAKRVGLSAEKAAEEERYSSAHSSVRMLQARIGALQKAIDRLTYSREEKVAYEREGNVEFYVPLQKIPELSFEAGRRTLALKSKEEIVKLFTTRLEQAKIDEASDLPSVSVVDLARPGIRVRPKRKLNVVIAGFIGLIVGCVVSWGQYYTKRALDTASEGSPLMQLMQMGEQWRRSAREAVAVVTDNYASLLRRGGSRGAKDDVRNG